VTPLGSATRPSRLSERVDALRGAESPALRDALRETVAAEVGLELIGGALEALDDEGGSQPAGREDA